MGKLIRMISEDGAVVCYSLDSTDIVAEAEQIHQTSAVVTAALGRLLTAASIMGASLKGDDSSVTLRVNGGGPSGSVIAVSDNNGNVRGYVGNPVVELPLNQHGKLDVAGAVGKEGVLSVVKDLGYGSPYIGQVPLVSGEIADDMTNYYATSEQIPTVCALGVLVNPDLTVKAAGGYVVQLLPGAGEEVIERLEKTIETIPPVTRMIDGGMSAEDIARRALEGFEPQLLDERMAEYRCNCSRQRVERAFLSLDREALSEMAADTKDTEASCHFCNKVYHFTPGEIKNLMENALK